MILSSILLAFGLFGCAGQTPQLTVGATLISMHDLGKTGAEASSALCVQKQLPSDLCKQLSDAYKAFQLSWPIIDDAWVVYAKAPITDTLATTTFNAAHAVYVQDYNGIMILLSKTGVIKTGVTK